MRKYRTRASGPASTTGSRCAWARIWAARSVATSSTPSCNLPSTRADPLGSHQTVEGGLLSYGFDTVDLMRRAALYVDRILKSEKPADLPVQAPTTVSLPAPGRQVRPPDRRRILRPVCRQARTRGRAFPCPPPDRATGPPRQGSAHGRRNRDTLPRGHTGAAAVPTYVRAR